MFSTTIAPNDKFLHISSSSPSPTKIPPFNLLSPPLPSQHHAFTPPSLQSEKGVQLLLIPSTEIVIYFLYSPPCKMVKHRATCRRGVSSSTEEELRSWKGEKDPFFTFSPIPYPPSPSSLTMWSLERAKWWTTF